MIAEVGRAVRRSAAYPADIVKQPSSTVTLLQGDLQQKAAFLEMPDMLEFLLRLFLREAAATVGPVKTALDAVMPRRLYSLGLVERSDRHPDDVVAIVLEVERRPAVRTEAARRDRRRPI